MVSSATTRRGARRGASRFSAIEEIQSGYDAAKRSRHRRHRTGLNPMGSGADYHYRSEAEFLRIMEQARDMDRNDDIVGQLITRATDNVVQDGFRLIPTTPDKGLNAELRERWNEWRDDPDQCDYSGEMCFSEMEAAVLRGSMIDGDFVALPTRFGSLQLIEAHRLRSPQKSPDNIIHGVELNENRKRSAYWFTKDDIDPMHGYATRDRSRRINVRSSAGHRQVFHMLTPKRITQTRGMSVLTPIMDTLGMFEDINFARLIQQQVVSCFAVFRTRTEGAVGAGGYGEKTEVNGRIEHEIAPGMQIEGNKGEELKGFSPDVPNPSFFEHMRLLLTLIGVNVGMPLVMVLMDASETNFSGWRGAIEQARMGFRRQQRKLSGRFHRNVYRWKVREWMRDDPAIDRADIDVFAHQWGFPTWPYIEPMKDAAADAFRVRNVLTSPRRLHAERDQDWDDIITETVDDNASMIVKALTRAQKINQDFPELTDPITWRNLISLPTPDRVSLSLTDQPTSEPATGGDSNPRGATENAKPKTDG